ncbi:MAG: AcrB/AcrD/AcrF family protein [Acidobacteria bacterium]|nr:MAG: AcrB/AcrD/AcrF family protein [Acidobacteriota bacterium]
MNPARVSSHHARAVLLVTVLLALAGFVTLLGLPSDIYPPLNFPRVVIIGHTGTLPARSMALSVTRPIEQVVMEVPGIRRVRSQTFRGSTEISAQFDPNADILQALQQVQNRVAELRGELPAETELTVERLTTSTFPILSYNLTGGLAEADLRDYAFYVVRPTIARVPGVGRVEVLSSDTREIEVVTQPPRLLASGLTVHDVAEALRASNQITPVARYPTGGLQYLVLASGLWDSVSDIGQTPVAVKGGAAVRVSDLGDVFPGAPDRVTLVTGNGKPAAIVSISQQVGANILDVRDGVEATLGGLTSSLPSGLHISKVYDLAGFVADAMASVRDAIIIGGVLAIIVLFVFLRSWRITLVAALTLPLTVISTFLFMRFFGETVNLMSMGGLAVAIGLVIDDAVVVVENIHRHLAHGEENAIEKATQELVAPVVGSTLTTVVVFAPLGLLSGVVGQFFRALSITLSVSVLLSLFLALSLIPLLAHWAYGKGAHAEETSRKLDDHYTRYLEKAMGRPVVLLVGVAVLIVVALITYRFVGSGFLPHMDEGGFVIDYLSPPGSALEETDRMIRKVEKLVADTPEVASFSRRTGSELGLFATQPNKGDVLVRLKPRGQRHRSADQIIEELRAKIADEVHGLDVEFVQLLQDMIGDLEGAPNPIEVKIFGDDVEQLASIADQIQPKVEKVKGVVDVVGVERGTPEVTWNIDPVATGRLGLNVAQVSQQLQSAWLGEVATELRLLDRTIPVRVRYPDPIRLDPNRLAQTPVKGPDGKLATIASLAHPTASAPGPIMKRENLRQMATITARLEKRDLGSAVNEVKGILAGVKLPVGYTVEVGGQYESQRQAFRELLMVLGIAASLVLVVLVIEFRSFTPAILILAAAPLSFGGALLMLLITRTELNVSSAMGFILLIGLVVKNGIVMIDYAHHLHAGGLPFQEAVERAARIRLRPILMTTLCTLFGLLPLALGLGAGAELQKPLALVVIGGLTLSTLVTLFAVPSFYVGLRRRGEARRNQTSPPPASPAPA